MATPCLCQCFSWLVERRVRTATFRSFILSVCLFVFYVGAVRFDGADDSSWWRVRRLTVLFFFLDFFLPFCFSCVIRFGWKSICWKLYTVEDIGIDGIGMCMCTGSSGAPARATDLRAVVAAVASAAASMRRWQWQNTHHTILFSRPTQL